MALAGVSERRKYVSHRSGLRTQFSLRNTREMSKYQRLWGGAEGRKRKKQKKTFSRNSSCRIKQGYNFLFEQKHS
jgi:hypothetical protein